MNRERGAVTIFVILIIVPIFLFNAVLIEFVRSRLADHQLETAVKAALRSIGAMYNRPLQAYGLYGVNRSGADAVFSKVVNDNIGKGLANTVSVSHSLRFSKSLADPGVFANQIMEEMKYQAPIEYTREVVNKIHRAGLNKALEDLSEFASEVEDLEKLREKRDEAMKRVWQSFAEWDAQITGPFTDLQQKVRELEPNHSEMRTIDIVSLQDQIRSLRQQLTGLETEKQQYLLEKEQYERNGQSGQGSGHEDGQGGGSAPGIIDEIERRIAETDQLIREVNDAIAIIEPTIQLYNEWMQNLQSLRSTYDEIVAEVRRIAESLLASLNEAARYNEQIMEKMNEWQNDFGSELIESVDVVSPDELNRIREQAASHRSSLESFRHDFARLQHISASALAERMNEYIHRWAEWMQQVKAAENNQAEREARVDEEQKKAEEELKRKFQEVLQHLTGCDPNQASREKEVYAQLKERTHGDQQIGDDSEAEELTEEHYGAGRKADKDALAMSQMIGQMMNRLTETMFLSEYALLSFNYRTFDMHTNHGEKVYSLTKPETHPLKNQEIEYILYGFHSCMGNYSAAFWEIFAFRLAIRTMESLLEPKNSWRYLGSPLVAFLWAMAEGAVKAYKDVERLADGHEVPIAGKITPHITMNYRDYLRLFLLIHGGKQARIKRMQALVEVNTGQRLSDHYTYWTAQSEGRMRTFLIGAYSYRPKVEAAWGYY